jgi:acyl-CoA synthetase (AMP-forming)/AMP-acid ligase II
MDFFDDIDMYGDLTAIITEDSQHISYRTLLHSADALKGQLEKRCLVFGICDNSAASVIGYIGFLRAKAVPVLISDNINHDFFNGLLETYKPEYVWTPQYKAETMKNCSLVYRYGNYVLLKTPYNIKYVLHDDLALLLTTSGSTGSPKLVRLSYKNITSNANSIAEYLGITQVDRPIASLPMSYSYALSIINSHFLRGCAIILTNKTLMNRGFWELLKVSNATTFGGVPYTYEMLKKLRFFMMKLPSLKVLTQAGGKLGRELSEEFAISCEQKGIRFFVMYGQAEASPRMSYLPCEYAIAKAGSIGIAIPGGAFWLEDDNGCVIKDNDTVGELVYKGENVCMGYAITCADLCNGDENEGILRTGDMAKRDGDGFYYIVGRKRRFLKLFGNRINLDEVEQLLKSAGYDCACTGEDDKLKIFVTNKENHEKIKNYVAERTSINRSGFEIKYIETIPRNESGKALYYALE